MNARIVQQVLGDRNLFSNNTIYQSCMTQLINRIAYYTIKLIFGFYIPRTELLYVIHNPCHEFRFYDTKTIVHFISIYKKNKNFKKN